eukprot:TRINITY_DN41422_c0_g1_i1.p1 TRINITY_DN41422_c0_g1~~TRINITY_DN41422_c0_g1_i1.p1  ORF type:complete len:313 (-),score=39.73 TRINITY_DN41422_c0_g1_i1:10-948(-)
MTEAIRQAPLVCPGHSRPVVDLQFSKLLQPDEFYLISACKDGNPMIRHGVTGDWIGTFKGHKGCVWGSRLNHDATVAATASADFTCKIWNAVSGECLHTFEHNHIVRTCNFNMGGDKVVTGGHEKLVRVFDINKPDSEVLSMQGHEKPIKALMFTSENNIISAGDDPFFAMWDIRTGKIERKIETAPLLHIQRTWDEKSIVVAHDTEISALNSISLEKEQAWSVDVQCEAAALSPDRKEFICGGSDFYVHVFDSTTGKESQCHKGHHGPVHCMQYSPDGEIFASGSEDGTIRLWQRTPGTSYGLWTGMEKVE